MQFASSLFSASPEFGALEFPTFRKIGVSIKDHLVPHARNNYHPHILSHRMLGLLSLLLMTVKIASISLIALSPALPAGASAITAESVVLQANAARAASGLAELRSSTLLARAAQNKANDMLGRQYFSHNTPDGATPWTFIKAVGYSYVTAGENLAIDFTEVESVQTAWMNSPGHRANILNSNFQEIGIGIAKGTFDGHDTIIVVQMFGTPIAQQVTLQEQPTPVAQPAPVAPAPVAPAPAQQAAPSTPDAPAAQPAASAAPAAEPITIIDTGTALQGDTLYVSVTASSNAVKLYAIYGNKSLMLDPADNNVWQGNIPVSSISPYDNLVIQAHDINGRMHQEPVAEFSESINPAINPAGNVEGASIKVFGIQFNPKMMEQKVFLVIIAALLSCLVLAIAIKRHVQHVSLVANTSFVAMLAAILLMT